MQIPNTFYALLILIVFAFNISPAQAQIKEKYRYIEAGMMMGLTNYSGDVSEKRIDLREARLGYGAYARYHFSNLFAVKLHGYSGSITGDDARSSKLKERSFRFATSITELALVGELHLFKKNRYTKTGIHRFQLYPFVYGGVGVLFANAQAEYYGRADLRNDYLRTPLPEEGLRSRFTLVPMGGGLRLDLLDQIIIGLEAGFRPVFSDDLDGVKINGNPNQGDWYYYGGATISLLLAKAGKRYPY